MDPIGIAEILAGPTLAVLVAIVGEMAAHGRIDVAGKGQRVLWSVIGYFWLPLCSHMAMQRGTYNWSGI